MQNRRGSSGSLKRKWVGLDPSCPEFVPQQFYGCTQSFQTSQEWVPRGNTTWQYDMITNRVVGGYYPQIRTKGAYLYDLDPVAFDPNIDVPIKVCFNCWQLGHPQQKCSQPKTHTFCDNCGRSNVTVEKCQRCARAYNRYLLEQKARNEIEMNVDKDDPEKNRSEESFAIEINAEKNEKSGQESMLSSGVNQIEEGYFSHDGSENLDDIIVDENLSSHECTSGFLQDFTILMDRVKMLTMETQNDVVQQFLAERRMQLKLQNMDHV